MGLVQRVRGLRAAINGRREAAAARRAAAAVPPDADADDIVKFLFSGAAPGLEPWQVPEEFLSLARLVESRRPRTVLEVGTADGGTLFAHARLAHPEALIISIDLPHGLFGGGYPPWRIPLYESFAGPHQRLELMRVDSHAPGTATRLERLLDGRRIDYAFIDGDHTYDGVRQDFDLCLRFAAPAAVIAFHDIVEQPNPEYVPDRAEAAWNVHGFWNEVRTRYAHEELIRDRAQQGYGIGVLYLDRPLGSAAAR